MNLHIQAQIGYKFKQKYEYLNNWESVIIRSCYIIGFLV